MKIWLGLGLMIASILAHAEFSRRDARELQKTLAAYAQSICSEAKYHKKANDLIELFDDKKMGEFSSDDVRGIVTARKEMMKGDMKGMLKPKECARYYQKAVESLQSVVAEPTAKAAATPPAQENSATSNEHSSAK